MLIDVLFELRFHRRQHYLSYIEALPLNHYVCTSSSVEDTFDQGSNLALANLLNASDFLAKAS